MTTTTLTADERDLITWGVGTANDPDTSPDMRGDLQSVFWAFRLIADGTADDEFRAELVALLNSNPAPGSAAPAIDKMRLDLAWRYAAERWAA